MPAITFSHRYYKLMQSDGRFCTTARLMHVFQVERLGELAEVFLKFDALYPGGIPGFGMKMSTFTMLDAVPTWTWSSKNPGAHLVLLFMKSPNAALLDQGVSMFTTIRPATPGKWEYYKGLVGQVFDVVIKEGS